MSDELNPCPKCGGTHRRATIGDRVRLVDVWCPDCKQLTDYGPIEGVLTELDALRAEIAAALAEAARLRAQVGQMFPFVEAFVETCYAEWDGHEYECPFCGAGHREFNRDGEFLDAVQEHAEGCTWREAAFWLDANAPKPQEPHNG